MTSLAKTMASFSRAQGILAVLFGLGFVLGFRLTPLGVEPRIHELRTPVFAAFFITIGLLLPLAGLVSLFPRKDNLACVLAVIDASFTFLIPPPPLPRETFSSPVAPPPAVLVGECGLIWVGIGSIIYGPRVYSHTR